LGDKAVTDRNSGLGDFDGTDEAFGAKVRFGRVFEEIRSGEAVGFDLRPQVGGFRADRGGPRADDSRGAGFSRWSTGGERRSCGHGDTKRAEQKADTDDAPHRSSLPRE